jgi:hypothetical protein
MGLRSAQRSASSVFRDTGLPSSSALVAPPLRLAALRWRVAFVVLVRNRPPSGVSAACLVAGARFSGHALPEGAPLENVPKHARSVCGTFSRTARPPLRPYPFSGSRVREPGTAERESTNLHPESDRRMPGTRPSCPWRQTSPECAVARRLVLSGARDSRAPGCTRTGAPVIRALRGPRGAWRPPVAPQPDASRDLSGAWLRHARSGEPRSPVLRMIPGYGSTAPGVQVEPRGTPR